MTITSDFLPRLRKRPWKVVANHFSLVGVKKNECAALDATVFSVLDFGVLDLAETQITSYLVASPTGYGLFCSQTGVAR